MASQFDEIRALLEPVRKERTQKGYEVCLQLASRAVPDVPAEWGFDNTRDFYDLVSTWATSPLVKPSDRLVLLRSVALGGLRSDPKLRQRAWYAWQALRPSPEEMRELMREPQIVSLARQLYKERCGEIMNWDSSKHTNAESNQRLLLVAELSRWSFGDIFPVGVLLGRLIERATKATNYRFSMRLVDEKLPEVMRLHTQGRDFAVRYQPKSIIKLFRKSYDPCDDVSIVPA